LATSAERISLNTQTFYEFGPFRLDPGERVLLRDDSPTSLPPKAFDLLVVMVERAGRLVTKEDLLNEVWQGTFVEEANLTYTVSLLRKALGDDAEPHAFIETVSKCGYRFKGPVTRGSHEEPAVESRARRPAIWLFGSVVVVLLLAFASWLVVHRPEPDPSTALLRLALTPPPSVTVENAQISPDGQRVAFIGREGEVGRVWALTTRLWVQRLDSTDASALPGTESAASPFWAPDSQTIAFLVEGQLKKINVSGGPAETLSPVVALSGGSWGRAGVILIRTGPFEPISQIPASGGAPVPVTKVDPSGKDQHFWPHFLPDGRHFLYVVHSDEKTRSGLYVGSLDSIEVKRRLLDVETPAIYGAPGYLLYSRDGSIVAQPFDLTRLEFAGIASPIAYDREYASRFGPPVFLTTRRGYPGLGVLATYGVFGVAIFSASDTGRLSYSLFEPYQYQFAWFDRGGKPLGYVGEPGALSTFDLSADGKRVIVARGKANSVNLWRLDLERGAFTQVTFGDALELDPRWGPDGRFAWTSTKDGVRRIMQRGLDGKETEVIRPGILHDWSPDGRYLIYVWDGRFALPLFGERKKIPLFSGAQAKSGDQASFSRDGRLIAYSSQASGRFEVYVQVFPPAGEPQQVSVDGGVQPVWRQDGRELYYLGLDGSLFAVDVDGTTSSSVSPDHSSRHLWDL
jgi:eukaryotic-like serine/threonine-protein kinase